ncbi:MAG: ribosomal-processing cysteine protease Prp [Solirubrobacterales bacterium]
MIKAVFKRVSNNLVEFKASGHAGAAESGYDIVCSAVSASTIMIANGITEILKISPTIKEKDGFLHINLRKLSEAEIEGCQVLMETMLLGLKTIEQCYGKYIKVLVEEV